MITQSLSLTSSPLPSFFVSALPHIIPQLWALFPTLLMPGSGKLGSNMDFTLGLKFSSEFLTFQMLTNSLIMHNKFYLFPLLSLTDVTHIYSILNKYFICLIELLFVYLIGIWHLLTIIFGVGFACSLVMLSICLFIVWYVYLTLLTVCFH